MMPLRLLVAFWQKGEIEKIVLAVKPDIVITTQTAPSAVLSVLKKKEKFTGLWGVAFSDYHFHRAWAYPRVDFYLPNIEEQMAALDRLGVPRDRMFRIGLAVPPQEILEKSLALTKLGLPTSARVVLVSSGTLGVGLPHGFTRFIDQLHSAGQIEGLDLRIVVACGRNEELQKQVGELARVREWLLGFGFYSPMSDLYAASDVMVSKPGGLTIAETILLHLPVFVTHMLPGQEKLNMNYLLRHKAVTALYTLPQADWVPLLVSELKTGKRRQFLEKNVELLEIIAPASLANLGKFVAHLFHSKNS
jgi:processive 1,2-diacylglycerol beta-glucosyltransferase